MKIYTNNQRSKDKNQQILAPLNFKKRASQVIICQRRLNLQKYVERVESLKLAFLYFKLNK